MESSVARSHRGHWQGKVGDQHALIGQHDNVVFGPATMASRAPRRTTPE